MEKSILIYPSMVSGDIVVPTSKSLAHRAIICASLAKGTSIIYNVYFSKDIMVTIQAMESLGANITINGNKLIIQGISDYEHVKYHEINVFESASTLRFLIPILSLFPGEFTIRGEKSLFARPLEIYEDLYKQSKCVFVRGEKFIRVSGKLNLKKIKLEGSISSQFVSGLLFALPLYSNDTQLIVNNLESKNYVFLTLDTMKQFGVTVGYGTVYNIMGNQNYCPAEYVIEGDYTQLANFVVLGTINNDISVHGLSIDTLQGDAALTLQLENVKYIEEGYHIFKTEYQNLSFDITDTPDLGPILMVLLTQTGGVIRNVQRLKYKESNRCEAMITEFRKMNIDAILVNNSIYIKKAEEINCEEVLESHNDHRIFMALAVLSTIAKQAIKIKNYDCIKKSYPTFLDDLKSLGVKFEYIN